MSIAFCVGNGESRHEYDLTPLKEYGIIYGANAIHRDYPDLLDYLVCCDMRMVDEAIELDLYKGPIFTRPKWENRVYYNSRVKALPDFSWKQKYKWQKHFHWGSGLHAVHLACKQDVKKLIMIGHDFYTTDGKHNNVYKNTDNYLPDTVPGVDYSFWVLQFQILFNTFPDVKFYFFQHKDWNVPDSWIEDNFFINELTELQSFLS